MRKPIPQDAAELFFEKSDIAAARLATRTRDDPGGLFVAMEAAALQLDTPALLDAALRLIERGGTDPRATVAAYRILDAAGNTADFRAVVSRVRALIAANVAQANTLRAALVAAASDGAPDIPQLALARESGLLTDWRVAAPFGSYPNVAFESVWDPERDGLTRSSYDGHEPENFRFDDGTFRLPDYFPTSGVLYAAANVTVPIDDARVVRVESQGSLELFVDGRSVLRKDDRLDPTPETVSARLMLTKGAHRVVVKFLATAIPFRVAFVPESRRQRDSTVMTSALESAYVQAATQYWTGDYRAAAGALLRLRGEHDSAAVEFMLAQALAHSGESGSDREAALQLVLKHSPSAQAAELELAAADLERSRFAEALTRARKVASAHPRSSTAQQLVATAAIRANSVAEAARAVDAQLELHPSCSLLVEAARFFSDNGDYDRARKIELRLRGCAPTSLAYARALADQGRHEQAAKEAEAIARDYPLDRASRAMLAKELMLAGNMDRARAVAAELVTLAPNAQAYRTLARQLEQGATADTTVTTESANFFLPYRREGVALVRQTLDRNFSGGPLVNILDDRIVRLEENGAALVYIHKLSRVLNRDGIEQYGEVAVPSNAEVLELRTIKRDLTVAEPEFNQHKATVSMPALAPGDAIDAEFVYRVNDVTTHPELLDFTFGSFTAPSMMARFVVIAPKSVPLQITSQAGPHIVMQPDGAMLAHIWETADIPQRRQETAAAPDALSFVRVAPFASWEAIRDFYRDALIDAVRSGSRIESAAATLRGTSEIERARALYAWVGRKIQPASGAFTPGDLPTAESTLARGAGNRTVALLAIARLAGLRADVLLTRDVAHPRRTTPWLGAYTRPLVLFRFRDGKTMAVDIETEGLAFGALPPTVALEDALLVPVTQPQQAAIVSIPKPLSGSEESIATGDIAFDQAGNLQASVVIRMGSWRAMQMRSVLKGIEPAGRPHFFEQLASRIFPGATGTVGEVRAETDPEQPLELRFTCQAQHFANFNSSRTDLDQLVPALGLRKMYAVDGPRTLPLYMETPLVETATFRIRLPQGVAAAVLGNDLKLSTEFGDYLLTFRMPEQDIYEVRRSFRIPVQVIPPDRFAAFGAFARQIDDAERQRITLLRVATNASVK